MKLVYVASPYTHKDKEVMALRAGRITQITAMLQSVYGEEHMLISPIAHGYQLTQTAAGSALPHTWEYWEKHDLCLLNRCNELWVVTMVGWDTSTGVTAEIKFADRHEGIEVRHVTPEGRFL